MVRGLALLLACLTLFAGPPARADPADIDAAARGVVRIIIVEKDGDQLVPVSHGTGFAVTPERVVTNSHVVEQARQDPNLFVGIVPSDGGEAVYGRLVSVSPRNDLALVATTKAMHLPPLTISGNPATDAGAVVAVGYPQNVDRAQGLNMADLFRAQPPVESNGSLAGRRPSREFDTLLHTAPIARGSSGGPLLDPCGRVVGVNSFGAESEGADAGFYFAISTRELLPFLRANSITPQINDQPCRSLADLNAEERQRAQEQKATAEAKARADEEALAKRREEARRQIDFQILDERDNGLALALVLLLVALGGGGFAWLSHEDGEEKRMKAAAAVAVVALLAAGLAWFSRPTFAEGDERLQDLLRAEMNADDHGAIPTAPPSGALMCTLVPERSRIVGAASQTVPLEWEQDGCVNGRTQYALSGGTWTRVFAPQSEANVSVNTYDPASGEYRMDRYLLDSDDIAKVREARGKLHAPTCGAGQEAARELGSQQAAVLSLLPPQPNERLVYRCAKQATGG
jgi:V8-like Glu-specific endopeptidase